MSKTKIRRILPIIMVTALVAVLLAIPCAASDAEGKEAMAITGALESTMAWMAENPESVVAAVITGIAGGVNLAGGVSNRKTRRSISKESKALVANSGQINNNAVELAGKVKTDVTAIPGCNILEGIIVGTEVEINGMYGIAADENVAWADPENHVLYYLYSKDVTGAELLKVARSIDRGLAR